MNSPASSAIGLKSVGPDDWELWRELRLAALAEAPYAFSSRLCDWQGAGDTEARWRVRLSSVPLNLVADLRTVSAGMVSATAPDENAAVDLISMWVAPFARGLGVGDLLVNAVVDWARSRHATRVTLAVVEKNYHASNLYRRCGFVDVGPVDCTGCGVASERQMAYALK